MLWLIQRQLLSKDVRVRRKAVERLGQAPHPRALSVLQHALADDDAEVRRLAVAALAKVEDEDSVDSLLGALRDRDAEVVKSAVVALKRCAQERVVPALTPLLRHPDAGVRGHAAQVLDYLGWRPLERDDEIWALLAKGNFSRLASFGAAAVPALESALDSTPSSLAVGMVEALGRIGDATVLRPLLHALKSPDPAVCVAAVDALCRLGGPQVVDPLLNALRHTNGHVRVAAVEALGRLRAAAALEPVRVLLNDPVWEVRREAAEALGRFGDPRAVDSLAGALNDGDADVREATAVALGSLGDRQGIGPLVLALKDSTSGVRRIAAAALSRIDTTWISSPEAQQAAEQLKTALQDENPGVRHFVGQLLVGMGAMQPETAPLPETESSLASSPAKRCKLAVSLFLAILCDADRDLRQAAAEALGRLGDERARSPLLRMQADPDAGVRTAAQLALETLAQA